MSAYLNCRKGKRNTINALKFEIQLEHKLLYLVNLLQKHLYLPQKSICFAVTYPKPREIFASDFADRIVHHLLINQIESYFEHRFIYDSFACRKNKGTHKASIRLKKFISQITQNRNKNAFYAKLDIQNFFVSIDKNILFKIIEKDLICHSSVIQTPTLRRRKDLLDILWLTRTIIFHDPTRQYVIKNPQIYFKNIPAHKSLFYAPKNKGLPIGNLTSQFFANVYLNELDQFVKRKLKVKYYLRYVDDLVLLSESPEQLRQWRKEIDYFLKNNLRLKLHPNKDKFGSIWNGIDFVGYIIKPTYTLSRRRVVNNLKTKLYFFNQGLLLISGNQKQDTLPLSNPPTKTEIKQTTAMVNSYYGHFKHANCYNLRKNIYEKHLGVLKKYLKPVNKYCYFKIQ